MGDWLLNQQGSFARHLTPFVDDLDSYSSGWGGLLEGREITEENQETITQSLDPNTKDV